MSQGPGMLIASYLIGYNDDGTVSHLAVDHAFPRDIDDVHYELCESRDERKQARYDLLVSFPQAESPREMLCLPNLPEAVAAILLTERSLPLVDFACGRSLRVGLDPLRIRRCA